MNWKLTTPLLAAAGLFAACVNPAKSYVTNHTELSPQHRQILLDGKVPDGPAVAGMTKEEVRLAMGSDPDQFTTIDGVPAWVYLHSAGGGSSSSGSGRHHGRHSSEEQSDGDDYRASRETGPSPANGGRFGALPDTTESSSTTTSSEKHTSSRTTIFFAGDKATRAEVTRE